MTVYLGTTDYERVSRLSGLLGVPREKTNRAGETVGVVFDDVLVDLDYGTAGERPLSVLMGGNEDFMSYVTSITVNADCAQLDGIEVPEAWLGRVFVKGHINNFLDGTNEIYPKSLINLVEVPREYTDLKHLLDIAEMYPNVRFTGGRFLMIDGLRVGRFEDGFLKGIRGTTPTGVADGQYDAFEEIALAELENVVTKPQKTKTATRARPRKLDADGNPITRAPRGPAAHKKTTLKSMAKKSALFSGSVEDF